VAIFPTDTVFGLGSNPRSRDGLTRCFEIKQRPLEKQVPVLFSDMRAVEEFVEFPPSALKLAETFWPGKLSIVLPVKKAGLPVELIGESKTLAVRIPNHECCRKLIASSGGSLIGTSANPSGHPPFSDPDDRELLEFSERADFFLRGNCSGGGAPSTVVGFTNSGELQILRQGAVSEEAISTLIRKDQ
jgi:L-threonylcarbamoyladenylate synthase